MKLPIRRLIVICLLISTSACAAARPVSQTPTAPPAASAATSPPRSEVRPDLESYFQGTAGSFLLYDLNRNHYIRYNPERCAQRFTPASTFKILNSLIGLETGVIPDENYVIHWDGTRYDFPAWNQDHTLKTAMRDSTVWYYQELARRVGAERMSKQVEAAGYGNRDISGAIDTFWLEGALRISAEEQVDFLRRFYRRELPFSARAMDIVQDILVLEKTESFRLSGKTGTTLRVTPRVGWFVGYLEAGGNVYFLATNIEATSADGGNRAREISRGILGGLGLIR